MSYNNINIRYLLFVLVLSINLFASQVRIKDVTQIGGSSQKNILGYGIVVGLDGTGDGSKSMFTIQSIANMLENFGISVDKNELKPKNVAAVMVTANFPSYAKKGTRLDVVVSSLGDAKSLQGGQLLLTPLTDPTTQGEGEASVLASGPVSIGGFNLDAGNNNKFQKNYTVVGRIPNGGLVNLDTKENLLNNGTISLYLNQPDYTTAVRGAAAINKFFTKELAYAVDRAEIKINVPEAFLGDDKIMEFISLVEPITISTAEQAKIVVNERTGTIVIGEDVKLSSVAISHGNLSIKIDKTQTVIQPLPFSEGETSYDIQTNTTVQEDTAQVILAEKTPTLKDLVDLLNRLGVTPRDMISIFQALKEAGALHANLVLI